MSIHELALCGMIFFGLGFILLRYVIYKPLFDFLMVEPGRIYLDDKTFNELFPEKPKNIKTLYNVGSSRLVV